MPSVLVRHSLLFVTKHEQALYDVRYSLSSRLWFVPADGQARHLPESEGANSAAVPNLRSSNGVPVRQRSLDPERAYAFA